MRTRAMAHGGRWATPDAHMGGDATSDGAHGEKTRRRRDGRAKCMDGDSRVETRGTKQPCVRLSGDREGNGRWLTSVRQVERGDQEVGGEWNLEDGRRVCDRLSGRDREGNANGLRPLGSSSRQ
jgi:hypothetical protein